MNKNLLYRSIPKVDVLLENQAIQEMIERYSRDSVMEAIRAEMDNLRAFISGCDEEDKAQEQIALLISHIGDAVEKMHTPDMKKVINGTGTILHTNLGRAPISREHMKKAFDIVTGYSNPGIPTWKRDDAASAIRILRNCCVRLQEQKQPWLSIIMHLLYF